jgi:hypothetical protein
MTDIGSWLDATDGSGFHYDANDAFYGSSLQAHLPGHVRNAVVSGQAASGQQQTVDLGTWKPVVLDTVPIPLDRVVDGDQRQVQAVSNRLGQTILSYQAKMRNLEGKMTATTTEIVRLQQQIAAARRRLSQAEVGDPEAAQLTADIDRRLQAMRDVTLQLVKANTQLATTLT